MATQYVGLRLDDDLVDRIDNVAAAQGTTRTAVIVRAIAVGLPEDEALIATLEGSKMEHYVERAVLSGLIRSNFIEVVAKLVGEEVDPARKKMIMEKLEDRKPVKAKLARGT